MNLVNFAVPKRQQDGNRKGTLIRIEYLGRNKTYTQKTPPFHPFPLGCLRLNIKLIKHPDSINNLINKNIPNQTSENHPPQTPGIPSRRRWNGVCADTASSKDFVSCWELVGLRDGTIKSVSFPMDIIWVGPSGIVLIHMKECERGDNFI